MKFLSRLHSVIMLFSPRFAVEIVLLAHSTPGGKMQRKTFPFAFGFNVSLELIKKLRREIKLQLISSERSTESKGVESFK